MNTAVIEAKNVIRNIALQEGTLEILKGVDLIVNKGQSVAILGESGSGKSTLLAALAGLDLPQSGSIKLCDQEITQLSEDQRALIRAEIAAFVFQSFYLLEELTALENVSLPLELFGHPTPRAHAKKWMKLMGLEKRSNHRPNQLSGGEQQRVALCRAFSVTPMIMFADEPTANLDQKTAQVVITELFKLHHESQNAMVLVTHDEKLASLCDQVYWLREGKLHAA